MTRTVLRTFLIPLTAFLLSESHVCCATSKQEKADSSQSPSDRYKRRRPQFDAQLNRPTNRRQSLGSRPMISQDDSSVSYGTGGRRKSRLGSSANRLAPQKLAHSNSRPLSPSEFKAYKREIVARIKDAIDLAKSRIADDKKKYSSTIVKEIELKIRLAEDWVKTIESYQDPRTHLERSFRLALSNLSAIRGSLQPVETHPEEIKEDIKKLREARHQSVLTKKLEAMAEELKKLEGKIPVETENKACFETMLRHAMEYAKFAKLNPTLSHFNQLTARAKRLMSRAEDFLHEHQEWVILHKHHTAKAEKKAKEKLEEKPKVDSKKKVEEAKTLDAKAKTTSTSPTDVSQPSPTSATTNEPNETKEVSSLSSDTTSLTPSTDASQSQTAPATSSAETTSTEQK